jgi:hypothetical protein
MSLTVAPCVLQFVCPVLVLMMEVQPARPALLEPIALGVQGNHARPALRTRLVCLVLKTWVTAVCVSLYTGNS